jgi:glutamate--cysteine ligase catalytic subunit
VGEVIARVKQFLFDTTTGNRLTLAQWMRRYVNDHPEYHHNSVLSRKVMSDLLLHLHKISIGAIDDPNFRPIFPSYGECSEKKLSELFQRE